MDDVDVLVLEELEEAAVVLDPAPAVVLGLAESLGRVESVRIAESDEPRALECEVVAAVRDRAEADERAVQHVGRSLGAPQHLRRNNVEKSCRAGRLERLAPSHRASPHGRFPHVVIPFS